MLNSCFIKLNKLLSLKMVTEHGRLQAGFARRVGVKPGSRACYAEIKTILCQGFTRGHWALSTWKRHEENVTDVRVIKSRFIDKQQCQEEISVDITNDAFDRYWRWCWKNAESLCDVSNVGSSKQTSHSSVQVRYFNLWNCWRFPNRECS